MRKFAPVLLALVFGVAVGYTVAGRTQHQSAIGTDFDSFEILEPSDELFAGEHRIPVRRRFTVYRITTDTLSGSTSPPEGKDPCVVTLRRGNQFVAVYGVETGD